VNNLILAAVRLITNKVSLRSNEIPLQSDDETNRYERVPSGKLNE